MLIYNDRIHRLLPIYSLNWEDRRYLYTPGLTFPVSDKDQKILENAFNSDHPDNLPVRLKEVFDRMLDFSAKQKDIFGQQQAREFIPECLTINISNNCHLNCSYCYTRQDDDQNLKDAVIDRSVVEAAARLVAANCKLTGEKFTVVFHGGGEPAFHWEYMTELFALSKSIARSFDIPHFSYISTNAFIDQVRAKWLADHFSLVGVSIDGPDAIHDSNRKTVSGQHTSRTVIDAVKTLVRHNARVEIRSTITPGNMLRQDEIVKFFIRELSVKNIRLEPKYGSRDARFTKSDADQYVSSYISAQETATAAGASLSFSGVRLQEIHGVYCDVLRNNLRIGPGDFSLNCFYNSRHVRENITGYYDKSHHQFHLEHDNIKQILSRALEIPGNCKNCFLEYHCSRGCPDFCWNDPEKQNLVEFRCEIHRKLALQQISRQSRNDFY